MLCMSFFLVLDGTTFPSILPGRGWWLFLEASTHNVGWLLLGLHVTPRGVAGRSKESRSAEHSFLLKTPGGSECMSWREPVGRVGEAGLSSGPPGSNASCPNSSPHPPWAGPPWVLSRLHWRGRGRAEEVAGLRKNLRQSRFRKRHG